MELAANLSWMYRELPMAERFGAAVRDGFRAVEILLPYDEPPGWYAAALRDHDLTLALFNTPVDTDGIGRLGWAALPGAQAQFRTAFDRARAVAAATGCRRIHVMAGDVRGHAATDVRDTLLANLEVALRNAEADDLTLLLEPLNRIDMPGYAYRQPAEVIEVLQCFDSPRLRLQFDFYHCVQEGLDVNATLTASAPWIGHVQIAGVPGRHEPDLARDGLLRAVAALPAHGYDSWIGCEYAPRRSAAEGLAWCAPLRESGLLA